MKPAGCALVTGASRGIGKCFAQALAKRSWDLILVARNLEALDQLAAELSGAFGIRVETIASDLTAAGAAAKLRAVTAERRLEVTLLVNNAGFGSRGEFSKLPPEEQSNMVRLNALALTELTHHFLPAMTARRNGAIINVSSTAAFQPMPYAAIYAATKAFVTSFSMALAEEVRNQGVTVVTLCPGRTRTPSESERVVADALREMERHGGMIVPRFINKVTVFSNRLLPRALSAKTVARVLRPRQ
jgi:uncharacterized protein